MLSSGFDSAAQRKLKEHGHRYAMLHTFRTAVRSSTLAQIADFIFSTAVDVFWYASQLVSNESNADRQ